MKHEILLEEACTAEKFLSYLYHQYPYDIEEKMVFSLLEKSLSASSTIEFHRLLCRLPQIPHRR